MNSFTRSARVVAVACVSALAAPVAAHADTFNVNTTADNSSPPSAVLESCPSTCTLRDAVLAADNEGGSNTINLPAGHYTLTLPRSGSDNGTSGELVFTGNGNLQLVGASAATTTIDATGLGDRVLELPNGGTLGLSHLTITGASVSNGDYGGAIANDGSADLTLDHVAVVGNVNSLEGEGGGMYLGGSASLSIDNSLLANNQNSGNGGAIYMDGGSLSITNSTLADNTVDTSLYPSSANWGAYGGAMEVDNGTVSLTNVTIAGNTINGTNPAGGTGTAIDDGGTNVTGVNVLIYGNTASGTATTPECNSGPLTSNGHNVDQDGSCFSGGTGDTTANPDLGPLQNNGGETETMAIGSTGSAYDAGSNAACPSTDQRGVSRPVAANCDIGAFELDPPVSTGAPVISGTAHPGQTLTCTKGTWTGSPFQTYTYQWWIHGAAIYGGGTSSYVITRGDVGQQLYCNVGSSTPGDGSAGATSAAVSVTQGTFRLDKVRLHKHAGTATLTAEVTGVGKFVVKGVGIKTVRRAVNTVGKVKLTIKLTGKLARELKARGKLKVKAVVSYVHTGGNGETKHKKITLIKKR